MSPLDQKLLRDLKLLRGQAITIALVVASGISAFGTLQSAWASLNRSRTTYYERYRFADVFLHLERAPSSIVPRLEAIPGVAVVYPRVVETVMMPLPDRPEPAVGEVVSLPSGGEPRLNAVHLVAGRDVDPDRGDETLLLASFAEAHGIVPGDTVPAVVNGVLRELRVVGLALSPEYVFPVQAGALAPDDEGFAVLWMDRHVVDPAFRMEGAFNDVVFRLQPGTQEAQVLEEVDRLLDPYGGRGAYGREDQLSNKTLATEMEQLEVWATAVPTIFLGVAAFLLNVVLNRVVYLQRGQIATLKAVGYGNRDVGLHYLKLVTVMVLAGATLGTALGGWLGRALTELYADLFRFPILLYRLEPSVVVTGTLISLFAAIVGAVSAVAGVVRMPPAEAMRPPAPTVYRRTLLERLHLDVLIGPSTRMVLRELERRPLRTLLSAVGISMAIAIMVVGRFSADALPHLMDVGFRQAMREDLTVAFFEPVSERGRRSLGHLPGVRHAEAVRIVPVRFRHGARTRETALTGYPRDADLRRVVDAMGRVVPLPSSGVLITDKLAEVLAVSVGDPLRIEVLEGERPVLTSHVAGTVDEMFGLQGHMDYDALHRLLGEEPKISQAMLTVDETALDPVRERLKQMPGVAQVTRRLATIEQFEEQSGTTLLVMSFILTVFAGTIAVGVIYNNARIALSTRSRDLASLRVLGFTQAEIAAVLVGEMVIQVGLAIPIGLAVGYWWTYLIAQTVDPEQYRLPVVTSPATYATSALVAVASAALSALLVRRRLAELDLIGVLKTRE